MQLEDYFEFSGTDTQNLEEAEGIRIKGHRIYIEHVLRYYQDGRNPDEIALEFPGLSLEKIYATITYYLSHRQAVDAYMDRIWRENEAAYQEWLKQPPSPVIQRLRALRKQQHQGAPA